MKYVVVLERTGNGWSAYVPDLPGCIAAADTRKEVERLITEAVAEYLSELRETKQAVPRPGRWTRLVEAS